MFSAIGNDVLIFFLLVVGFATLCGIYSIIKNKGI